MPPTQNSSNSIIKIITGVVVIALAGFALSKVGNRTEDVPAKDDTPELPGNVTVTSTTTTTTITRTYKDGTYNADGSYTSPAGKEEIGLTLTIKDDVVISATFVGKATNPGSVKNQELFEAGFKTLVVGKAVDSINLTVVNGSSLTPKGFMDALTKIKTEAKA